MRRSESKQPKGGSQRKGAAMLSWYYDSSNDSLFPHRELYYGRLHRMDLNDPDIVNAVSIACIHSLDEFFRYEIV